MNARERLFRALRGEPTDRVPLWLLFPYHPTPYYVDVRAHPRYRAVFEASLGKAIVLNRRTLSAPWWGPEVIVQREEVVEDGWQVRRTRWRCGSDELRSDVRSRDGQTLVRRAVETDEDLDRLLRFPVETDPRRIQEALDRLRPRYEQERAEFPSDLGAMMLDLGEPIGCLYALTRLESLAIWSLERPGDIVQFLDRCMARQRLVYEYALQRNLAEVYFMVGSELAAPPLVSVDTFRSWIVPYARELIERIHARGARVIQHFHGAIRAVIREFPAMGADALHTIEEPPVGDCTLSEAYEATGGRLTLIGNIQYDELRSCTEEEMRRRVIRALDECRGRRFILSPTAGPYEQEVAPSVIRNYLVMLDTAWEYPWSSGREEAT